MLTPSAFCSSFPTVVRLTGASSLLEATSVAGPEKTVHGLNYSLRNLPFSQVVQEREMAAELSASDTRLFFRSSQ